MAVACYASTPVLLSWFLLLYPPFAVLPIVVAAAWVLGGIGGMVLGGLCSAAGLI